MGATTYITTGQGAKVENVFNGLVKDALFEYGHDSYNGTISTTSLGANITNKIPANVLKNKKALNNFLDNDENYQLLFPKKWETTYIDLGIDHYKAYSTTWFADKETPQRKKGVTTKQEFSYGIKNTSHNSRTFGTLSEAKNDAKNYMKIMKQRITLFQHRSDGSKFQIGYFDLTTDGKKYKTARQSKTKIYMPVNEYIFFVYAAC